MSDHLHHPIPQCQDYYITIGQKRLKSSEKVGIIELKMRYPMIELKEIKEENFRECIRLNVSESQKNFVASNVYSIAQAYIHYGSAFPYGIYQDESNGRICDAGT
jgi:hypothetical protein